MLLRLDSSLAAIALTLASLAVSAGSPTHAEEPAADPQAAAAAAEFFEREVRPVLMVSCLECHGPETQEADVRVDALQHLLSGNENGPLVVPGDVAASRLLAAIRYDGDIQMPPDAQLPEKAIEALSRWVEMGAPWPESSAPLSKEATAEAHWAYQAIGDPQVPDVNDRTWAATPIDCFVLSQLEAEGLEPSRPADRATLIRRLSLDLVGLPPEPEAVAAFVNDPSPAAVERLVDRLLESPRFGERWGRYWLDLARYADTKGYVFTDDRSYKYAYLFRDWVVDALNRDLPYDRFLMYQLAADQMPPAESAEPAGIGREGLAAMGFLTVGRRFLNNPHDIIDDRIDVVTRGMMGVTVACARCHDHKYDPIPTADYYSLYGVFAASEEVSLPLEDPSEAYLQELQKREAALAEFNQSEQKDDPNKRREFRQAIADWKNSDKAPLQAMVLQDKPAPQGNPQIFVRGNPGNRGEAVPRQFLRLLEGEDRQPFTEGSGRLELARRIVDPANPLTPRVWVNRVWEHLIGQGFVDTSSDFGVRSDRPSHPELLDFLAKRLVEEGWSTKRLIRQIVLSSAYQQSSEHREAPAAIDPENRLLWRMNRRRLDFEGMRDSLLVVSASLDHTIRGPSVDITTSPFPTRRTVYSYIDRQNLPGLFRTFDFASPDAHTPRRYHTTVPQQALYLMNHPFAIEQAQQLIARADRQAPPDAAGRIGWLYQTLYARPASDEEVAIGRLFLEHSPTSAADKLDPWARYAQVLLMSNEFLFID
ncbi:PSD1 and planctomycete cytochrome C domain-containing protein [Candidatus Laterigemmans baculatus]|uniref:PSD1 and planctomycete cytochrome C domain-containing protein n=1 Tax=Candidatus Laterigemmans baculatus TaxID=2770505 RepID=UPI0013D98292|nr:PSD1 and planctomycete cytochrome C domain-containing protein [Candidatus Laterigemmans baculatus]